MKEFIRNLLKKRGYDIIKTGVPYFAKPTKDTTVKVGKFDVLMPPGNTQIINYLTYPDLNFQLGRLVSIVASKYKNMAAIDVGANVGDTIAVIKSFEDIPVVGIEGDEISYSYLINNTKQFANVSIVKTFLSETAKEEFVEFTDFGTNAAVKPTNTGGKKIEFKTLDEVVLSNNEKNNIFKILKVDVEGFDTIVLRGATNIISKDNPVLFFEYNRKNMIEIGEDGLSTLFSFTDLGYDAICFFDHKGSLVLSTSLEQKQVISDLHDYASSASNLIGYYDICIFHKQDADLAKEFIECERKKLLSI